MKLQKKVNIHAATPSVMVIDFKYHYYQCYNDIDLQYYTKYGIITNEKIYKRNYLVWPN